MQDGIVVPNDTFQVKVTNPMAILNVVQECEIDVIREKLYSQNLFTLETIESDKGYAVNILLHGEIMHTTVAFDEEVKAYQEAHNWASN